MIAGVAVGKTWTGAHFAIWHIVRYPDLTGGVFANTYDQLSQATLRELMYWLDEYGFEYVIDRIPPENWGSGRKFKSYNNILSVRIGAKVAHVFTRVLSKGDALRGLEFSWYWMDESRDTPKNTHDIILSRLRESSYVRGLITTTPAGEDWVYDRFVVKAKPGLFGSLHVRTEEGIRFGLITREFFETLRHSYSPNMAAQELDAQHVVVLDGRVYYTFSEANKRRGFEPNPDLPLILGCDFNFSPAPLVWEIGQLDEDGEHIHWFDEFRGVEVSTEEMAYRIAAKYPDFFFRIFGDASGERGTSSNAGETDFVQIADVFHEKGVQFTIDTQQQNPRVRDRTENTNRMLKNSAGEIHMTVDPDRCPLLTADCEKVIWKNGKTYSDDCNLTHASDGVGYALMKLFPPLMRNVAITNSVPSRYRH